MAHFKVCLLFLLTCQRGQPVRVGLQDASSQTSSMLDREVNMHTDTHSAEVQADIPAWTLSYNGVPCLLTKTDEGGALTVQELGHLASRLFKWGDALGEIYDEADKLAREKNCRVCDIGLQGSSLPITMGKHKPWIKGTVACATSRRPLIAEEPEKSACFGAFDEHGTLNSPFAVGHPRGACMPCPSECASCEMPGATDYGYATEKWFKCNTYTPQDMYETIKDEYYSKEERKKRLIGNSRLLFRTEKNYFCEQAVFEELEPETTSVLKPFGEAAAEELAPEDPVPNFKKRSTFAKKQEWKVWCKYKDDYTTDVEEHVKTPAGGYIVDGRWSFESGITDCRNTVEEDKVLGDSVEDLLPLMSVQAASDLEKLATLQNCRLCDVHFGGYTKALLDVEEMMQAAVNVQVLTDVAAVSEHDLWIKPVCAAEKIGLVACDNTQGAVGWASSTSCLPCPSECAYCELRESKKPRGFKCFLMPKISYPSPTLQAMTSDGTVVAPQPDKPSRRPGYECDQEAEFRNCASKSAPWCDVGHMKVECTYPATFE